MAEPAEIGGHVRALQHAQVQMRTGLDAAFATAGQETRALVLGLKRSDGSLPPDTVRQLEHSLDLTMDRIFAPDGELMRIMDAANAVMLTSIAEAHQRYLIQHLPEDLFQWLGEAMPRPLKNEPIRQPLPEPMPEPEPELLREAARVWIGQSNRPQSRINAPQGVLRRRPTDTPPGVIKPGHAPFDANLTGLERVRARDQSGDEFQVLFRSEHLDYDPLHKFVSSDGYTLSRRLWLNGKQARKKMDKQLIAGVQSGASAEQVARNMEGLLKQKAKRRGSYRVWRPAEPGAPPGTEGRWVATPNVPYPAWRLARTEISASAGRFTMASARANPFVQRMEWRLSQNHPRIDICDNLAQSSPYPIDNVPPFPAHPNCLCILVPLVTRSPEDVVKELRAARERGDPIPYTNPADAENWARWGMGRNPAPVQVKPKSSRKPKFELPLWPIKDKEDRIEDWDIEEVYKKQATPMDQFMQKTGMATSRGRLLSPAAKDAERYVLSSVCTPVNLFYWRGDKIDAGTTIGRQAIKARDGLLKLFSRVKSDPRAPGPPAPVVWRGMSGDMASKLKKYKPGDTWGNEGYTSTSQSPGVARSFAGIDGIIMEIKTNPNKKGLDFSAISTNYHEQEYLIDKGTEFRFVGVKEVQYRSGRSSTGEFGSPKKITVHQFEEI